MRPVTSAETIAVSEIILRDIVFPNIPTEALIKISVALSVRMSVAAGAEWEVVNKIRRTINRILQERADEGKKGGRHE